MTEDDHLVDVTERGDHRLASEAALKKCVDLKKRRITELEPRYQAAASDQLSSGQLSFEKLDMDLTEWANRGIRTAEEKLYIRRRAVLHCAFHTVVPRSTRSSGTARFALIRHCSVTAASIRTTAAVGAALELSNSVATVAERAAIHRADISRTA
jgi:hypothetical protein